MINSILLDIICCPVCHGDVIDDGDRLSCGQCERQYDIRDQIPDLRVYESREWSNDFNRQQALYEAELHDVEAESDYETNVIRVWGTKTSMMVEDWAEDISRIAPEKVLDYGCGTGQVSRILSRHVTPLFAFDISEKSLRKNMNENNVIGVLANALYLPFKDGVFNAVCINGVLHHIVDLKRSIVELSRITNGRIYISEGMPRDISFGGRINQYPSFDTKIAYSWYQLWYLLFRLWDKVITNSRILIKHIINIKVLNHINHTRYTGKTFGSKYERPLSVDSVELLLHANGFKRIRVTFYTNIDIPGDGILKRKLTKRMVNSTIGTHFDLRMDRN